MSSLPSSADSAEGETATAAIAAIAAVAIADEGGSGGTAEDAPSSSSSSPPEERSAAAAGGIVGRWVENGGDGGGDDEEDEDDDYDLMAECLSTFDDADDDYFASRVRDGAEGGAGGGEETSTTLFSIALPPNLHPAASAGMRTVSSCYFSIGSRLNELDSAAAGAVAGASSSSMRTPPDGGGGTPGSRRGSGADLVGMPPGSRRGSRIDLAGMTPGSRRGSGIDLAGMGSRRGSRVDLTTAAAAAVRRCESSASIVQLLGAAGTAAAESMTDKGTESAEEDSKMPASSDRRDRDREDDVDAPCWSAVDVLYHDVMMRVFAFLPLECLRSFSETSRRANFECFYYLQLQMQGALLNAGTGGAEGKKDEADGGGDGGGPAPSPSPAPPLAPPFFPNDDALSAAPGSAVISRLASVDAEAARGIVNEYMKSNASLRTMPLSHSLAYLRHALLRSGFHSFDSSSSAAAGGTTPRTPWRTEPERRR